MTTDAPAGYGRTANRLLLIFVTLFAFALVQSSYMYSQNWRVAVLSLVGIGLGFVLFQSSFGFAGSFRALLERRDASGFKAQAIAIGICSIFFFPLLATGNAFGQDLIRLLIDCDSWASQTAMILNLWCQPEDWHGNSNFITGRF